MFVDPDLLRMGAGFAESAGVIAKRGAQQFGSVRVNSGIFGGFAESESFHQTLAAAHDRHARSAQSHHEALKLLAEKATSAASTFTGQDEDSATALKTVRLSFHT
jgi:hypothetical protein